LSIQRTCSDREFQVDGADAEKGKVASDAIWPGQKICAIIVSAQGANVTEGTGVATDNWVVTHCAGKMCFPWDSPGQVSTRRLRPW